MRRRAAWVIAVFAAATVWCAPAGAAQISGSLQVTAATPNTVSFTFTVKRTCSGAEQCDYYSEIDQLPDTSACTPSRASDPWILWTGDVQNTGPTTETGRATPRGWASSTPTAPTRLCLYTYADEVYYLVDDVVITRPTGDGGTPGSPSTPGGGTPKPGGSGGSGGGAGGGSGGGAGGGSGPGGSSARLTCLRYTYQQSAQKALKGDQTLAARLDRNGNGVACENLPKHKTYITTVAMRDAATATRLALRDAHGAAFTQGTRYRARCARAARTRVRCAMSWRYRGTWSGYVDVVGAIQDNERIVLTHLHVKRPRR